MARPFIREPDLVRKLEAGRTGGVECVSCNMCLAHDGFDPLRCWRTSPRSVWSTSASTTGRTAARGSSPHKCGNPAGKPACVGSASWAPNHGGVPGRRHRTFPRESPPYGSFPRNNGAFPAVIPRAYITNGTLPAVNRDGLASRAITRLRIHPCRSRIGIRHEDRTQRVAPRTGACGGLTSRECRGRDCGARPKRQSRATISPAAKRSTGDRHRRSRCRIGSW